MVAAMKVRRVGNALLKSHPSPLLSFLAPSIPASLWNINGNQNLPITKNFQPCTHLRSLATRTHPLQVPVNATAEVQEEGSTSSNFASSARQFGRSRSYQGDKDEKQGMDEMLDLVPETNPLSQNSDRPNRSSPDQPRQTSSVDLLKLRRSTPTDRPAALGHEPIGNKFLRNEGAIAQAMSGVDQHYRDRGNLPPLKPPIRLDAFVGRSEQVDFSRGNDLARKLRLMDMKLAQNKVRGDFMAQRFHERAGLKRKRLKSQRWRKRFKAGFKAVVKKVQDMKKRGW